MKKIKLNHGEYIWPEHNMSLNVYPHFIVSGMELSFSQAFMKKVLIKKSKTGDFETTADGIRILSVLCRGDLRVLGNIIIKLGVDNGSLISATPYPKSVASVCGISGFTFAANDAKVMDYDSLGSIYLPAVLSSLGTVDAESVSRGIEYVNVISGPQIKTRFKRV